VALRALLTARLAGRLCPELADYGSAGGGLSGRWRNPRTAAARQPDPRYQPVGVDLEDLRAIEDRSERCKHAVKILEELGYEVVLHKRGSRGNDHNPARSRLKIVPPEEKP
jgi:hypothetical protein